MVKGALHSFTNVLSVDIESETYSNIGAYTDEHMISTMGAIRQVPINMTRKKTLAESLLILNDTNTEGLPTFFKNYLSTSLLYVFGGLQVRLHGRTSFNNIWLIDRSSSFGMTTE
jgi:hypothetical protein